MKAGDLERNLTHLVEVAKAARACLASVEGEVSALKLALDGAVPGVAAVGVDRPGGPLPLKAVYK